MWEGAPARRVGGWRGLFVAFGQLNNNKPVTTKTEKPPAKHSKPTVVPSHGPVIAKTIGDPEYWLESPRTDFAPGQQMRITKKGVYVMNDGENNQIYQQISDQFSEYGYRCNSIEHDGLFSILTGTSQALRCTEPSAFVDGGPSIWPTGKSFWFYGTEEVLLVRTSFPDDIYRIREINRLKDVVAQLGIDGMFPSGVAVGGLTREQIEALHFIPCHFLYCTGAPDSDDAQEALDRRGALTLTKQKFLASLAPTVEDVVESASGQVEMRLESATSMTRFPLNNEPADALGFLFEEGFRDTDSQVRLFKAIVNAIHPMPAFDCEWENRVNLNDPYYLAAGDGERPAKPLNAPAPNYDE